ncbi:hypothetical protein IJJ53_02890 [Candidatus Saccharibacteria bacterium]|nr:hypothetical protein [Candidatus Saccharibacteria bacterium]
MRNNNRFKKGAASFYIVAISTLILVIIAASFAAVIISEVTRTSNDDLAQSAYDSALAGIEDAKLAYYNYQSCVDGEVTEVGGFSCNDIRQWIEQENGTLGSYDSCDGVAVLLGRNAGGEVFIKETQNGDNNMQQAYTCVKLSNVTKDIEGTISEANPSFVVRAKFDGDENAETNDGTVANKIDRVKIKWYLDSEGSVANSTSTANFGNKNNGLFGTNAPVPAVISVGMVQTSSTFNLSDFDMTVGSTTDRGTIYLVPYTGDAVKTDDDRYIIANSNYIAANDGMLKSNDKTVQNRPFAVQCTDGGEYACEATIEIPRPVGGGARNKDTFVFRVALPYGGPKTDFALEFYCENDECPIKTETGGATDESLISDTGTEGSKPAPLRGVQVEIDSTGRANDLYRRVETRLMPADTSYPYPLYAIQVLGDDNNGSLIEKNLSPTCEHNFIATSNCE